MTLKSRRNRNNGQVLIEASCALALVLGTVWLNLELVRRAQLDLLLHHASFLGARARAMGAPVREARWQMKTFLTNSWGRAGEKLWRATDYTEDFTDRGGWVHLHARFPSLWSFRGEGLTKHHFESTRKCLFPFSADY